MTYKYTNELIKEKSPYLLQHAHNPVDWHSWSEKSFEIARNENKPIFLSIGYSTCHWCHVMERESFEDIEVAKILNDNFLCIKVDKEERPDIDSIYMRVCQILTGSGGWPLTIFMTPDQKPFYAGTYFPKISTYYQQGLIEILNLIIKAWSTKRDILLESSNNITNIINQSSLTLKTKPIKNKITDIAFQDLFNSFDNEFGGFGDAPKFPMPTTLYFLMRYYYSNSNKQSLSMITKTLEHIYRGGIFDHIGFGFSRYSTDNKWLVPHFEKMLYDNALLSISYIEAYQATNNNLFERIAKDIFSYILRDMTSLDGGFYSAEDADSEDVEGKYYIWTHSEIIKVLGEIEGEKFCKQYNITHNGNFDGKNIPNLINSKEIYLEDDLRKKLFAYRSKRIPSYKDDKILTSWNSLMIAALAIGSRVFKIDKYINASTKAVSFIYNNLFNNEGRLLARYRDGEASFLAYADDYAFLIWGLIELYESTFDVQYLQKAIELNNQLIDNFWDAEDGGLYLYANDSEQLIYRPKEIYDGVIPSANSVSTMNWIRLFNLTGDDKFKEYADKQFTIFGNEINVNPSSCSYMLSAYLYLTSRTKEIVIVGDKYNKDTVEMINVINKKYNPYITVLFKNGDNDISLQKIVPFIEDYKMIDNKTTAYICSGKVCAQPITDLQKFKNMI